MISLTLIEITDQHAWEQAWSGIPHAPFLQSWAWGEFRKSGGLTVKRMALTDTSGNIVLLAQGEFRARRFGLGYWFFPRGPIFAPHLTEDEIREAMTTLCQKLVDVSGFSEHALFWRMEPFLERAKPEGVIPLSCYRHPALNPTTTELLDLRPSEEDLLARMHEKTRYNIRLAERKGVQIRTTTKPEDIQTFLNLMDETAERDGFTQHDRAYLEQTITFVCKMNIGCVRVAEYEGKILSANVEIHLGDTVTYLYGTSSSEARNVMAPFALHWNAIQSAKADGFSFYDFWGANPEIKGAYDYKPSWEGITRFKRGWGGVTVSYAGTWDLPLRPLWYRIVFWKKFFRD